MISQPAQRTRDGLVRDTLDETPIVQKRSQWEESARNQPLPSRINTLYTELGGVPCNLCLAPRRLNGTYVLAKLSALVTPRCSPSHFPQNLWHLLELVQAAIALRQIGPLLLQR